ncbi:SagB/ThcOx family dehydrogenase [Paenibacillus thiaminolyticus]|uniref:SagB/ThcOx family dehydrogenase n=1 Tax=Paenibacillus thiaminolyticus TaxID=49283 RepID=UPI003D295181
MPSQSIVNKSLDKSLLETTFFWSPSVTWELEEDQLRVATLTYSDMMPSLFPDFFFITQKGARLSDLISSFPHADTDKLAAFIKDLIRNKILVDRLLSPQELYFSQNKIFHNPYSEETFVNPQKYDEFKTKQLNRSFPNVMSYSLALDASELPMEIRRRKSYRKFDEKNKVPFSAFSQLLSAFRQNRTEQGMKYNYATAGGLYPIDLFCYVKDRRVDQVKAGLYYYNPVIHEIQLVSSTCVITEDAHYFMNQEIFQSSAISLFMVYDANVTMPKYGGMGYYFASIDTGIMVQLLTQVAELNQMGLCSIGEMNFRKIEKYFKLTPNHMLIHSVELGLQPAE